MEIDSVIGNEIARRLNDTPRAQRGRIVEEYLPILGCNRGTFYKEMKKFGFDAGKKPRKDKDVRRTPITDEQLRMIAGAMKKSKRKKRKCTMPATVAVEIAAQAGVVPPDTVDKVSTINRLLRKTGMSKGHQMRNWTTDDHKIPAFYTPLVSEHPNEWHCFDITPCTQYYFNKKGLRQRDENLQLYGGKLKYFKDIRDHLLRYVIVDHKSDVFFFRYFYAAGEKITNLVDFLYEAWAPKNDEKFIFQGVPVNLYLDKGSANTSQYIQNMCKNLKINLHTHKAGNPRAKGKVEGYMKIIQEQFESRLSLNPATSLEELNKWAYEWMVWFNAAKMHRRTQYARMALWSALIKSDFLRTIESKELFFKSVKSKPFPAIVSSARTITVDSEEYLVKGNVNPREQVICNRDYFNLRVLHVHKQHADGSLGEELPVLHIPKNRLGEAAHAARLGKEYKRFEDTVTTIEMKAMDKLDYSAMSAAAFSDKRTEIETIGYLEKPGMPLLAKEETILVTFQRHEVFREIRFRTKRDSLTTDQSETIEKLLENRERIEDSLIDEIIRRVFDTGSAKEDYVSQSI